ncbi:MAG: GNAT family N-acetyltransferase [Myxococcales bacterium]|nr:GNAT family N-acetyltransferase [Myxococcales bacterium]
MHVRAARTEDRAAIAVVWRDAFLDDPVWAAILPDPTGRGAQLFALFSRLLASRWLRRDLVHVVEHEGEVRAAAAWSRPGEWKTTAREIVGLGPGLLFALGTRAAHGLVALERVERHHPLHAHFYLAIIGTAASFQGRGAGAALLAEVLPTCDRARLPAYLESSNPRNQPFYRRHGFVADREIPTIGSASVTPMTRPPSG